MISHYLKIALRNIFKDKIYSLINLIGLSVAIACCFLFIFWIRYELSFEDCYPKVGRIFKVLEVEKRVDGLHEDDFFRREIASQLKKTFPEIEASTFVYHTQMPFIYKDMEGIMADYTSVSPDYLDIFTYEYIEGSKENVLKNRGVIMSEETARKFFGKESAVGKIISYGKNFHLYNVQAVVRIPQNTQLKFGILDPFGMDNCGIHYVLVKENTQISKEAKQSMTNFLNSTGDTDHKLYFQPLKEVHLHSPKDLTTNSSGQTYGDLQQIYLFSIVTFLILVIAIINYVNTSTARAMSRMKEVGIRKVSGSTQRQLILRFLSDSFILSAVSVVLALIASRHLFAEFSMVMGNYAHFSLNIHTILIALIVCIVITILSGGYAAFYLASFSPIIALRGGANPNSKENLRKGLIGFQFILSIGMLISTLFIYKQTHYMFSTDTGVDRKNIIILDTDLWYKVDDFIQVIKRENPNIIDATIANVAPYNAEYSFSGVSWEGSPDAIKNVQFGRIFCDYHYANTFGLKMIAGEFIQPGLRWWQDVEDKSYNIVINQAFQKLMGVDNPIGITVNYGENGKIIGVVKDFNFKPLKEPITPLIICFNPEACTKVFIKTTGKNKKETLAYILKKYKEMGWSVTANGMPVMYHTVEDDFNTMYKTELRTMKILTVFSVISLFLSVMGIFGMVLFMIEKRMKEIAIRRINGAETKDIIGLFLLNFIEIIGIACLFAIPVSFIILNQWIQTYSFRTSLSWWIFIIVPLVVSLITTILISVQVFFATRRNPVEFINSE